MIEAGVIDCQWLDFQSKKSSIAVADDCPTLIWIDCDLSHDVTLTETESDLSVHRRSGLPVKSTGPVVMERALSPIYYVSDVKGAVLIMLGKQDSMLELV